ncbi:hypothetical protein GQ600_16857 [Phytophthora cactorum]|nr:hypothetical protein GQ600_16857 [Phytophthora cactorum]
MVAHNRSEGYSIVWMDVSVLKLFGNSPTERKDARRERWIEQLKWPPRHCEVTSLKHGRRIYGRRGTKWPPGCGRVAYI